MNFRKLALIALTTLLLGSCGPTGPGGRIPFESIAGARGPDNGLDGTLKLPAGFILDSFGPRGVHSVCAPAAQTNVTPDDRASGVISAALWLRGQPDIDPDRIGLLGGSTAAWVTQAKYEKRYPGLLKASVDYYAACRVPETHGTVPLLAMAGKADSWGQPALTRTFARKMRADQPFELHTHPGVVHAFDNPRQQTLFLNEGHPMLHNQPTAEDGYQRVRTFLAGVAAIGITKTPSPPAGRYGTLRSCASIFKAPTATRCSISPEPCGRPRRHGRRISARDMMSAWASHPPILSLGCETPRPWSATLAS